MTNTTIPGRPLLESALGDKTTHEDARSKCPALPVEIWGRICENLNDFDLWLTCRSVSRTLRAEAEREYACTRLPSMTFRWRCYAQKGNVDNGVSCTFSASIGSKELLGFSEDGFRARFGISIRSSLTTPDRRWLERDCDWGYSASNDLVLRAMSSSDLDFEIKNPDYDHMHPGRPEASVEFLSELGPYINDVPFPELQVDLDAHEFSFAWKTFLDNFWRYEADVQNVYRHLDDEPHPDKYAKRPLLVQFQHEVQNGTVNTIHYRDSDDWISDYAQELDRLCFVPYMARLRRVCKQEGASQDLITRLTWEDNSHMTSSIRYGLKQAHWTRYCGSFDAFEEEHDRPRSTEEVDE